MAHYAKIENNYVTNIIVADQDFINSGLVGDPLSWIKVLNDNGMTIHYAGIGFIYDVSSKTFIPPKPFDSWTLVNNTWVAPVSIPQDNKQYMWDESAQSWVESAFVLPGA